MKKTISRISLLLVLAMLLGVLAGCKAKNEGEGGMNEGAANAVSTEGVDTNSEEALLRPDEINFGGYEYIMMVRTNEVTEKNLAIYKFEGERATQVTDIAIWKRQHILSDVYGVNLTLNVQGDNDYTYIGTNSSAGEYFADAVCMYANRTMSAAKNGYIYDINTLDNLNLEASYWDQRMIEEFTVGDSLFCLEGDFNFLDDLVAFVVLYNDKLYKDYHFDQTYGSPYEMVSNNTWTLEKMKLMIEGLGADINDDGKMNEDDMYGLVGEGTMPYYLAMGAGIKTLTSDNGNLVLNIKDDTVWANFYDAVEATMELSDSKDVLFPNRNGVISASDIWAAASDVFEYDRALFRTTALEGATRCVGMSSDYGILPIPKYTEEQDGYYCWVNAGLHNPISFPATAQDIDKSTQIAEIIAYHSKYGNDNLYNSFYDLMAEARLCRTEDDAKMLKLVFENKTYDLDRALDITGILTLTYNMVINDNQSTLYSDLVTARSGADAKLVAVVNSIMEKGVKKEG